MDNEKVPAAMQDNVTRLCASCGRPLIDGGVDWYCGTSGCEEELTLASAAASAHRLASTAQPEVKALVEAADEAMQVIWQYKNDLHFPPSSDSMGRRLARASEVASQVERALATYHEAQP